MLSKCPTTGKSRYHSRGEALAWLAEQRAWRPRRSAFRMAHRAYHCPHCGDWHATKQPFGGDRLSRLRDLAARHWRLHD